jgi:uncharacterized transporter YbjL
MVMAITAGSGAVAQQAANTPAAQTEGTAEKALAEVEQVGSGALELFEPVVETGLHGFFELLDKQPIVFLLLALAIGYPLGRVKMFGISLGSTAGTLLTGVVIAYIIGMKVFKLNSVICDGACTGARNSTPGLNAITDQSKSAVAAVPYPVTYALTTVLALVGGYVAMLLS